MSGPPVVLTNTLGRPVTNVISERGAVPMTVVNTLGEPVTLVARGGEPVTLFNPNGTLWDYPFSLFANNEQGAWYDPSDFSTLYQNSTGTTPVTAVEQPVGLMLDRSRGLVLGSELYAGGVSTGTAGYANYTAGTATWEIFRDAGGVGSLAIVSSAPAFTTYLVTLTMAARGADSRAVDCRISSGTGGADFSSIGGAAGNYSFIVRTGNSVSNITLTMPNIGFGGLFTNISVKSLPGNHASQATSASRPVLRSRYNLLTYTEDFSNAIWSKNGATAASSPVVNPRGVGQSHALIENTANSGHGFTWGSTLPANTAITIRTVAKRAAGTRNLRMTFYTASHGLRATINLDTQTVTNGSYGSSVYTSGSCVALTGDWFLITITGIPSTTEGNGVYAYEFVNGASITYVGDNTSGFWFSENSILTSADQTSTGGAYQRIAAATDYDVSNPVWRPYLAFDGVDDFMSLASAISITTDMTVVRGFGRSAAGIRSIGLGTSGVNIYDGYWFTDNTTVSAMGGSGAVVEAANTATGSFVFTSRRNASTSTVRRNGTQIGSVSAPSVINSFGAIGLMNVSYNNGPIYGLIVLDRELTGSELTATEQWMAGKTGVTL